MSDASLQAVSTSREKIDNMQRYRKYRAINVQLIVVSGKLL